jgi:hypothetical protein
MVNFQETFKKAEISEDSFPTKLGGMYEVYPEILIKSNFADLQNVLELQKTLIYMSSEWPELWRNMLIEKFFFLKYCPF